MKKTQILFVISSVLANGGVPLVTMEIIDSLKEMCSFDIIVCGNEPGFYDEKFKKYGGDIFRVQVVSHQVNRFNIIKNGHSIYKMVLDICEKKHYDVIHCENGLISGPALKAAEKKGVPIRISHAHGTYTIAGKNIINRIYKKNCLAQIEKYATVKLACSQKAGESLFKSEFINILNPLDVDMYQQIEKTNHKSLNILQIGYYCKLKNQLFSLNIVKELLVHNKNIHMYFIGYDDGSGYYELMKKHIKDYNLENVVTLLPSDFEKQEIFKMIDCLVLPSTSEGLPIVTLESQAANVPCLVSDVVSKDIDMGLCYFLPIDSPAAWARVILEINNMKDKVLNIEKLDGIKRENYMKIIKKIYDA